MSENLADEQVVGKRKKQAQLQEQQWQEDLKTLMKCAAGQHVLWAILERTKMLAPNVYAGSTNDTIHRLGQRDFGVWLYNEMISADVNLFTQLMAKEQNNAR